MESFLKVDGEKINMRFIVRIGKKRVLNNPVIIFTIQTGSGKDTYETHIIYTDIKKRDEDFDSIPCVTHGSI